MPVIVKTPYDQAVLSFGFNALEYTAPDKIKYAYYLQGWDKDWNFSGNIRNINYNNIRLQYAIAEYNGAGNSIEPN